MKTEAEIEARLVRYCREHGIYTRKFTSPAHRGVPDRVLILAGKVLFLELKRPGNIPTALQLREIRLLREAGVNAEVTTGWPQTQAAVDVYFGLHSWRDLI